MHNNNEGILEKRYWRIGPYLLSTWACLLYHLIILAFALPRLGPRGWTFPLYAPGEYVEGGYPLFWLVYLCLPLLARDIFLSRKQKRPLPKEVKFCLGWVLLGFAPIYHFIFGWF